MGIQPHPARSPRLGLGSGALGAQGPARQPRAMRRRPSYERMDVGAIPVAVEACRKQEAASSNQSGLSTLQVPIASQRRLGSAGGTCMAASNHEDGAVWRQEGGSLMQVGPLQE